MRWIRTRRNLEINQSLFGAKEHSLIGIMDSSVTPMGSRMLRRWLNRPIRDQATLRHRYHAIGALLMDTLWRGLRQPLWAIGDKEKARQTKATDCRWRGWPESPAPW